MERAKGDIIGGIISSRLIYKKLRRDMRTKIKPLNAMIHRHTTDVLMLA